MKGIYLAGGYPDSATFMECFRAVDSGGFDFIEVGIPFNDPIADGPVIADAIHASLKNGITPDTVMNDILSVRNSGIKKYVMTYANIIYSYGIKKFSDRLSGCLDGVIIPGPAQQDGAPFLRQWLRHPHRSLRHARDQGIGHGRDQ